MTILIVGDSWGLGELDANSNQILHQGLAQYLVDDGYEVVNLSKGGISNLDIINRLNFWFDRNPDTPVDKIFVLQTDFARDFKHNTMQQNYGADDWNISTTQELISIWVERFYQRLSEIAQKKQCEFLIIGGLSDTMWFDNMENDYPGCKIVCQSVTNLILTSSHTLNQPVFGWFTSSDENLVKKLKSCTEVGNLTNLMSQGMERELLLTENPEFFFPDGRHPNRRGWKIVFDFLKEQRII